MECYASGVVVAGCRCELAATATPWTNDDEDETLGVQDWAHYVTATNPRAAQRDYDYPKAEVPLLKTCSTAA